MFKKYLKDTSGNMAAIFAVSAMALLIGVGAATDFSSASKLRSSYQSIADTATLAAARSGKTTQADLLAVAQEFVAAHNVTGDTLTTSLTLTPQGRVQVNVTGDYDTMIMGMFGMSHMGVTATAEAPLTTAEPVNVALVLDVTGSMSGAKLASLKTAAIDLIETLEAFENDALKISVVPFARYVNVGLSRRSEVWLDVMPDWTETYADNCSMVAPVIGQTNCRWETYPATPPTPPTPPGTCYNDGVPYSCGGSAGSPGSPGGTTWVCDPVYGPEEEVCYTPGSSNHKWHGCVGSRLGQWHENVEYVAGKKIPGLMNETRCSEEILPLTNDLNSVKASISALTAGGNTYIPAGLSWGWRTLDVRAPLTEANGPYASSTQNVLILMTDGANTISKTGLTHEGNNVADANNVTEVLCDKISAAEIDVYTIAYDITDTTTINLIKNCASAPAMFYDASNSAALQQAFHDIGQNLLKLRLTR